MIGRRKPAGGMGPGTAGEERPAGGERGSGEPSDAELLRRHVAGDAEAFGTLFSRHKDRLWAVALRTACDPEDAADALQEAMVSAFRRAGDFRGDSAVTTWLHRIVVNAAVDRLRRRSTRSISWPGDPGTLETLAMQAGSGGPPPAAPAAVGGGPAAGPADAADAIETRLDVDAALRMLPVQQRTALVLVDMLGYPVAEAAGILGVSTGTVKSRCARGRARLLPYLSHLRGDYSLEGNRPAIGGVSPGQGGGG
jgi:RNA polymerase sigma-70 factor (ECF subfamily)